MKRIAFFLAGFAIAIFCLPASADVTMMDKTQLQHAMKLESPCCVIDGRAPASREKQPLADALPYTPGMKITPTAAIVVVGDNDRQADKIARELHASYPGKRVIAVKGGIGAWEATLVALSREAASKPGFSFVIPKNTCESGTAIQHLRSNFK
jgi:hypothetical protein